MQWQISQKWIARWSRTDYMIIIESGWTNACKKKYDGKCARVDKIAVQGTANGEESSRQLILGNGFKIINLI